MIFLPLFGCASLHFGVGEKLKGLTLGFVNEDAAECFASKGLDVDWFGCKLEKMSCRYLEEFDQTIAKLVTLKIKV